MLTVILAALCLIAGIVSISINYVRNYRFYKLGSEFPGPKKLPIIGNSLPFIGTNSVDMYNLFLQTIEPYPSPSRFWSANRLWILISDPDQLKTVLTSSKTLAKSELHKFGLPIFGSGLLVSQPPVWRVRRKLIQPAFTPRSLSTLMGNYNKHSNILLKKLSTELDRGEFKLFPYIATCTLGVVLESTLGITDTSNSERNIKIIRSINRCLELISKRISRAWLLMVDSIYNLFPESKDFYECSKSLNTAAHDIIRSRKKELFENPNVDDENESNTQEIFLDLLLKVQREDKILSDQDICDEVKTMIIAGYDTTAIVLQCSMLMLACHSEIQNKVYQELYNIYGHGNIEKITIKIDDLQRMEYLERVIKEAMRLFSPAPVIIRRVQEEVEIGGLTLPKDATLLLLIGKLHRDEKYWKDPYKFDPDRFLPEEIAKRHPYCYMPFSSGPRNCIGGGFAMMEMKVVLAKCILRFVLRKENIKPIRDIKIKLDTLGQPAEPVEIKIERRVARKK